MSVRSGKEGFSARRSDTVSVGNVHGSGEGKDLVVETAVIGDIHFLSSVWVCIGLWSFNGHHFAKVTVYYYELNSHCYEIVTRHYLAK